MDGSGYALAEEPGLSRRSQPHPEQQRHCAAARWTRVRVVADKPFPVQWTGQQAVITLPRHIDDSSTDQVRDQLLGIINCGAAVLIADLTGTVYCDYSGAYALARAQLRANACGTELRLVATSDVARRVFTLSGPGRPVAVYPDLDGAIAAGAESRALRGHAGSGNE